MINALEDYHTCTVCSTTVHDFGPGADAVLYEDAWYHRGCVEETRIVGDILTRQLEKSVQQTCKHCRKGIISTSESGSNTCYVLYYCRDCKKSWNDELLPADYEKLLADYQEPE